MLSTHLFDLLALRDLYLDRLSHLLLYLQSRYLLCRHLHQQTWAHLDLQAEEGRNDLDHPSSLHHLYLSNGPKHYLFPMIGIGNLNTLQGLSLPKYHRFRQIVVFQKKLDGHISAARERKMSWTSDPTRIRIGVGDKRKI